MFQILAYVNIKPFNNSVLNVISYSWLHPGLWSDDATPTKNFHGPSTLISDIHRPEIHMICPGISTEDYII